jgi:opine dehydrogenase
MNITVIGGGNIGTQFAVHSSDKGHSVKMFTSNPSRFSKHLFIVDKSDNVIKEGEIVLATSDPHEALHDAEMIMITMPPTMMIPLAQIINEHADPHAVIGFVPGNGGFEFAFRDCIERGNVLFGIDRVPAIARLKERGRTVCCSGYKDRLYVAALPSSHTEECAALIESIYDIPCVRLPGFMALTLTPSNPILHTARLMTIFSDYEPGVTYESLPLFYEEWDDASSELLLACDDEIQDICRALPWFGLEYVVSEREFYNADTVEEMTYAIRTEESLLGLTTPSVCSDALDIKGRGLSGLRKRRKQRWQRIEQHIKRRSDWREILEERRNRRREENTEGLIPDLHSRYFTADFPYGLSVIQQIRFLLMNSR